MNSFGLNAELFFVLQCVWFLLPMGLANMAPVLFRHQFKFLAIPVDNVLHTHGVFGGHKTVRGILVAAIFGGLWFWWQQLLAASFPWARELGFFDYAAMSVWFGFVAGFGAILGDLIRSAAKRRLRIPPGGFFLPWDQLDYMLGGILLTAPFFRPPLIIIIVILIVGFLLHVGFSAVGYALGMKKDRF